MKRRKDLGKKGPGKRRKDLGKKGPGKRRKELGKRKKDMRKEEKRRGGEEKDIRICREKISLCRSLRQFISLSACLQLSDGLSLLLFYNLIYFSSHYPSLPFSLSISLSLTHTHTHSLSLFLSLSFFLSLSLSHSFSLFLYILDLVSSMGHKAQTLK